MAGSIKGITLEISGNTTKLQEALKQPVSATKELRTALGNVDKALKLDPKNVELLNQKQQILTKTISSTEDELKLLKEAQKQYVDSGKDITGVEYTELEKKIAITERSLEKLKNQQNNFNGELQSLGIKAGEFGEKMTSAGEKMMPVTAGVTAIGAASVTTAASFESAMSQVQATMGITSDATSQLNGETVNTMDAMNALAKQMGAETAFSAKECADAINYLALAGYDTQATYDTLPTVLNLAAAGSMDLATASDMVTDAMSALGMETDEAGVMVDQMAKTASSSNTSVAQLGEAILKIGGTAKTMKGGTVELNTALGILADNGVKGAEGGTALRNVLLSLQAPSDKAAKLLAYMGVSAFDSEGNMRPLNETLNDLNAAMADMEDEAKAETISTIFNKNDIASVNALLANSGERWDELSGKIEESAGSAQLMADTQLDNLQGQLTLLQSALEGAAISIGEYLMPVIKKCVELVQRAVDWFNGLSDAQKGIVVAVGAAAAAIGPLLIAIGKMSTGLSSVIKYFGSVQTIGGKVMSVFSGLGSSAGIGIGAFAGIAAAIGAVVGAFVTLWKNNEEFRTKMVKIWNDVKSKIDEFCKGITDVINSLGFEFSDITEAISAAWNGFCELLAPVFEGVWQQISNAVSFAVDFILGVVNTLVAFFKGDWEGFWSGIQDTWDAMWTFINESVKNAINTVLGVVSELLSWFGIEWTPNFEAIDQAWQDIWGSIGNFIDSIIAGIQELVAGFIALFNGDWDGFTEHISKAWDDLWEGVKQFASDMWDSIGQVLSKAWEGIKKTAEDLWNKVKNFFSDTWNSIKQKAEEVWNNIKRAVEDPINAVKKTCEDVWNGLKTTATETWNNIKRAITDPINDAKQAVSDAIDKIKGFFNFQIEWPDIPVPHFTISGSLNPLDWIDGGLPNIGLEFYAKAMNGGQILNGATIFGMQNGKALVGGEAGPEAVVGVSSLRSMINEAVDQSAMRALEEVQQKNQVNTMAMAIDYERMSSVMVNALSHVTNEISIPIDGKTVARQTAPFIDRELNRMAKAR